MRGQTVTASDVFARELPVTYAAAGLHAFGISTGIDHRIVHAEPDLSGIPAELVTEVTAALSKNPDDRPDAEALVGALSDVRSPQSTLVFPTTAYTRVADDVLPLRTSDASDWSVPVPDTGLSRTHPAPGTVPQRRRRTGRAVRPVPGSPAADALARRPEVARTGGLGGPDRRGDRPHHSPTTAPTTPAATAEWTLTVPAREAAPQERGKIRTDYVAERVTTAKVVR
ncbi:hypothetical protein [Streptomyces sp. NK15101]|uniref:hypothetical protein n=1 Tax=Streptomyces sp. NK15101 TaxID=2873261 RepID=UPI001CED1250|nr:hypothetical protein [Streptomyces sp. NK15101]